jgi:hypothetical protein
MQKRIARFLLGVVIIFILTLASSQAAIGDDIGATLEPVFSLIAGVMNLLAKAVYMKVLLWIMAFALMNYGARAIKLE